MNLQEMTNEQLCDKIESTIRLAPNNPIEQEVRRRLCAVKSLYQVRYKFMPNDADWSKMPEAPVRATSPLNSCQVLVDANFNWLDQDMLFRVHKAGNNVEMQYGMSDLE